MHDSPLVRPACFSLFLQCKTKREERRGCPWAFGIFFNWNDFAQTIVENTPLNNSERSTTRVCIVNKLILADTSHMSLKEQLDIPGMSEYMASKKGFTIQDFLNGSRKHIISYANALGFESCSTGWHSFIIQETDA
ncbi:MAG: hypothetical protein AAGA18_06595 [Verrucomicrobiota bacterium]